jgi:large subunit ribosomal protein L31
MDVKLKPIDVQRRHSQGNIMKKELHPNTVECTVSCACGNTFTTKSTKSAFRVDICNECHPFYTGSERQVDTAGRIDKFKKRYALNQ